MYFECVGQKIVPLQRCQSLGGWQPVLVESGTRQGAKYVVHVNPWGDPAENLCECRGFQYRGRCRHQEEAFFQICGWHEMNGKEAQNPFQRKTMQCPRCGNASEWTMEVVDDPE